jgi:hypothetical protein
MNNYVNKTLTELYALQSKAIDAGEIELVAELQYAIHAKNVMEQLFFKAMQPHLVSRCRKRRKS